MKPYQGGHMNFYDQLQNATHPERIRLFSSDIIVQARAGQVSLESYIAFLQQAYHHVKHTVPLLMGCGSRLPDEYEWLRRAIAHYITEEIGHEQWILNDLTACGEDKKIASASSPHAATERMISYAYDVINRRNPLGFFGMVFVLEGTSISLATQIANILKSTLNLPDNAFSYLYSHGDLDTEHVEFFKDLMNRIRNPADQEWIIHCAKQFYFLYRNIFEDLPPVTHVSTMRSVG